MAVIPERLGPFDPRDLPGSVLALYRYIERMRERIEAAHASPRKAASDAAARRELAETDRLERLERRVLQLEQNQNMKEGAQQ